MSNYDFSHFKRQAPGALLFIFLRQSKVLMNILFPVFILAVVKGKFDSLLIYLGVFAGIELLALVSAWLSFRNFRFRVTDEGLQIMRGTFQKKEINIPFSNIQNIQTEEGFWYQLFDLSRVKIDTAGSNQSEAEMVLELPEAEALKVRLTEIMNPVPVETAVREKTPEAEAGELNFRYTFTDLMRAGITLNHFRGMAIILAFIGGLWNQFDVLLEPLLKRMADEVQETVVVSSLFTLLLFVLAGYVISLLISLMSLFIKRYGLQMRVTPRQITYRSGLMEVQQKVIKRKKLTYLTWSVNPLERLFGLASVEFAQHLSVEAGNAKNTLSRIPGFWAVDDVRDVLFPAFAAESWHLLKPASYYRVRNMLFMAVYPALIPAIAGFFWAPAWFIAIAWLIIGGAMALLKYKKAGCRVGENLLFISNGAIADNFYLLDVNSLESVVYAQSVFQRRRGLASLKLHTRNNQLTVPFIPQEDALKLYNYLLYKNEV